MTIQNSLGPLLLLSLLVSCASLSVPSASQVTFAMSSKTAPRLSAYYGVKIADPDSKSPIHIISSYDQSIPQPLSFLTLDATVRSMTIYRKGTRNSRLSSAEAAFLARYYPITILGIPREKLLPLYPMDNEVGEIVKYLLEISGSDRSLGDELDSADREEIRVSMIKGSYELYSLRLGLWNNRSFELGKAYEGERSQFFFSLDRDVAVQYSYTVTAATIPNLYIIRYESRSLEPASPVRSSLLTYVFRTAGPWNTTYEEKGEANPLSVQQIRDVTIEISSPIPQEKS